MDTNMKLMCYVKKVNDKKHGKKFDKDKVYYKGHTFDLIYSNAFRKIVEKEMTDRKLSYPLIIEVLSDPEKKHYFTKAKVIDSVNKVTGEVERKKRTQIVLLDCVSIAQGEFSAGKSLDNIVEEIDGD